MPSAPAANAAADSELSALRQQLFQHPLYQSVQTADNLRLFMREHVFAVWDFMSLLKRLQQMVTCCTTPWFPPEDAMSSRFINEIVLGEECDEDGRGGYASHYELYLQAMEEVGADIVPIRRFVAGVRLGRSPEAAFRDVNVLPSTREFVQSTMRLVASGQPHEVAAAFFHGREDVIPDMFARLVQSLPGEGVAVERLVHYLKRHIEVDAADHGPLARRLVDKLCDDDPQRRVEVQRTAIESIAARIRLWDGVLRAIHA
jgi:pyrroloquinoline quinone (PQQ) biosynthesis protein C